MRKIVQIILLFAFFWTTLWVEPGSAARAPAHYPEKNWERVTSPEQAGWSSEKLKAAREYSSSIGSSAVVIIYGGKITRFDYSTGQVQNISPEATRSGKYRFLRTAPVIFSPVDPRVLFFAGNVLFKTTSGGNSWDIISPDLSAEQPAVP